MCENASEGEIPLEKMTSFDYNLTKEQITYGLRQLDGTKSDLRRGIIMGVILFVLGAGFIVSFLWYDRLPVSLSVGILCVTLAVLRFVEAERQIKKRAVALADGVPIRVDVYPDRLVIIKEGAADREILLDNSLRTVTNGEVTLYFTDENTSAVIIPNEYYCP